MPDQDLIYRHYDAAERDPRWKWAPYFVPKELACPHCHGLTVRVETMDRLLALRIAYQKKIFVESFYRCPAHNWVVTKKRSMTGAHTHGRAIDPRLEGGIEDVPLVLDLAWTFGFTRSGLELSKAAFRMHLDDMTAKDGFKVRDDGRGLYLWTY